jgi:hypothetical protein
MVQDTEVAVVDYSDPSLNGTTQGDDGIVFGNREWLSRVDTLKGLIVEEGAVKEGRLLHTIEGEFFLFFLLRQPSRTIHFHFFIFILFLGALRRR